MITRFFVITVVAVALVGTAQAATLTIEANAAYRTGQGGEFTIVAGSTDIALQGITSAYSPLARFVKGDGSLGGFETFCIEYNETISPTAPYDYSISSAAVAGGAGGRQPDGHGGTNDPVSIGTAWLYWQFSNGSLAGYSYPLSGRQGSAGDLQNAIWYLEDEISLTNPSANIFISKAITMFGSIDAAKGNNNDAYNVRVLNLVDVGGTGRHQDQLVRLVPEGGATVVLMGLALTCLGLIRRKVE
jgi:hypothetical protein